MTCGNSGLTRLLGFASDRVIEKITTWVPSVFKWVLRGNLDFEGRTPYVSELRESLMSHKKC